MILIAIYLSFFIVSSIIGAVYLLLDGNKLMFQNIVSVLMFGATAAVYYLLFESKGAICRTFTQNVNIKWLVAALVLWVAALPLLNTFSVETGYNEQILMLVTDTSVWGLVNLILSMGLLTAIVEEWTFRGVLQRLCIQWTKRVWAGIIIASAVFSAIHFDMPNFFVRFLMGIILGLLYQYSGSIWTNIVFHFINNALAAVGLWIYVKTGEDPTADFVFPVYTVVLSVVAVIGFVVYGEMKSQRSVKSNYIEQEYTQTEEIISENQD